jgi:hypothetical protein
MIRPWWFVLFHSFSSADDLYVVYRDFAKCFLDNPNRCHPLFHTTADESMCDCLVFILIVTNILAN